MKHIGSLSGDGKLLYGDELLGPVRYHIDAWHPPGPDDKRRGYNGWIEGDREVLNRALNADKTTLIIEGGHQVTALIMELGSHGNRARIEISGAVPGF